MTRPAPIILEVMRATVSLHWQVQTGVNLKRRLTAHPTRAEATQSSTWCLCQIDCVSFLSELRAPGYAE